MALKYISPPVLLIDKYSIWKKEMQIQEMATSWEGKTSSHCVSFPGTEGQRSCFRVRYCSPYFRRWDGKGVWETWHTLLTRHKPIHSFGLQNFRRMSEQPDTSIEDFINFGWHVTKLKYYNILLLEPVLFFKASKSANLTLENERLVKATIGELTLSSMSGQLRKIMYKQSSDASSPNTPLIMMKNEVDVIAYKENNQTDNSEVYHGHSLDQRNSRFNGWWGKINRGGRQHKNNNKTHSTDKKNKK